MLVKMNHGASFTFDPFNIHIFLCFTNWKVKLRPLSGCSTIVTFQPRTGATNVDWPKLAAFGVKRSNHINTACGLAYTHRKYGSKVYGY